MLLHYNGEPITTHRYQVHIPSSDAPTSEEFYAMHQGNLAADLAEVWTVIRQAVAAGGSCGYAPGFRSSCGRCPRCRLFRWTEEHQQYAPSPPTTDGLYDPDDFPFD